MPLPLTVSCFSKIQIGFTFLVPAYPGSPGLRAIKRVCVCVVFSDDLSCYWKPCVYCASVISHFVIFCVAPTGALGARSPPVHWTAWTPGLYATEFGGGAKPLSPPQTSPTKNAISCFWLDGSRISYVVPIGNGMSAVFFSFFVMLEVLEIYQSRFCTKFYYTIWNLKEVKKQYYYHTCWQLCAFSIVKCLVQCIVDWIQIRGCFLVTSLL